MMSRAFVPYIGVTDFDSEQAVIETLAHFKTLFPDPLERRFMVGVMMSWKTLNGKASSWSEIWPKGDALASLFMPDPSVYNTLHYADYSDETTISDLCRSVEQCGDHIHALQLDMILPDAKMLEGIKSKRDIDIILQINPKTLHSIENDIDKFARVIYNHYEGIVDVCLLDLSMGRGKEMDASVLAPYVSVLQDKGFYVAIAGGLGPNTMHNARDILTNYDFISIDAQGQLRPSKDAHDPLDYAMVCDYISSAAEYLG